MAKMTHSELATMLAKAYASGRKSANTINVGSKPDTAREHLAHIASGQRDADQQQREDDAAQHLADLGRR